MERKGVPFLDSLRFGLVFGLNAFISSLNFFEKKIIILGKGRGGFIDLICPK
jgi:hypothetical protein